MNFKLARDNREFGEKRVRTNKEDGKMAKMKSVQVSKAGADFEVVECEIPEPGSGNVRIRVLLRGVCHSDVITKRSLLPGMS